jgi:bifunctional non-homologous end joining protein LigD
MLLGRRAEAFSHPDWLFELKYDGFRALALVDDGVCRLVSRNGNAFKSFESLRVSPTRDLRTQSAVLGGEIVCLDRRGRPNFADLFYRHRDPVLIAFDLLHSDRRDMRKLPMELRRVLRTRMTSVLYCAR